MDRVIEYNSSPRLNASTLKSLDNPKWIKFRRDNPDIEDEDKRHYRVGSAIDTILTTPERFNEQFAISYKERPSGLMGIFIDALPLDLDETSDVEEYRIAYEKSGYKTDIKAVIKKLWEIDKYRDYYLSRKQGAGRIIISYDEYEEMMHSKDYILNNPYISKYFINTNPDESLEHQIPIYWEYYTEEDDRILCKSLLDGVLINHKDKTVQPFDLKTTGKDVRSFPSEYVRLGYWIQAGFYQLALTYSKLYKDYEILPFQFIVVEKKPTQSNPARIFQCSGSEMLKNIYGGERNKKYVKGVLQLIEDYNWHEKHDFWDLPRDLILNNGKVMLESYD